MISKRIKVNPFSIARVLGVVAFLLALASTAGQLVVYMAGYDYSHFLVALFNLSAEQNIPTFFSSFLLLSASLLLFAITLLEKKSTVSISYTCYWSVLSWGFLFMALDEFVMFHEKLGMAIRGHLSGAPLGFFHFVWVVPGIIIVLILAIFFLKFSWSLPTKTRYAFLMAATVYLGGAIGVEMIGGYYAETHGMRTLTYSILFTVEESLEMTGVIYFIWALMVYIANNYEEVRFQLDEIQRNDPIDDTEV